MKGQPVDSDEGTEARLLEAAHRVFMRRGTAGARTQEIADEAGVNKALLHYYFRSKEKLAEAVFLRSARLLFPRMFGVLGSGLGLRDKLTQAATIEMEVIEANPFLPGYVLSELQYRPDRLAALLSETGVAAPQRRAALDTLQAQIDAEVEAHRLRAVRAESVVVTLISLLILPHVAAPLIAVLVGPSSPPAPPDRQARAAALADFVLRGFAP